MNFMLFGVPHYRTGLGWVCMSETAMLTSQIKTSFIDLTATIANKLTQTANIHSTLAHSAKQFSPHHSLQQRFL